MKESLLLLTDLLELSRIRFEQMTTISKNVSIDSLNNIVNRYNNTVHKTIKMTHIDVTNHSYAEYSEDFNKKVLNLKLATM